MCSTLKSVAWMVMVMLMILTCAGCQQALPAQAEKLNDRPMVVDEAMQRREWEPTVAHYQSGATVAGPTGFWYEPSDRLNENGKGIVENPLFVGQVLMLPVTLSVEPVWTPVIYRGVR